MSDLTTYRGGCHCGAVRFEADAPRDAVVQACNCSICTMTAYLHLIVPAKRFRLATGQENLVSYRFNTGAAKHYFCKTCGIKSFYVPRSNPDGFSINVRCLDDDSRARFRVESFDGQNWEANAAGLRHLTDDQS